MARQYWLMKSEPYVYSIDDLERDGTTYWDGVRNYAARNLMRDKMRIGDRVLYYHSNAKPPGVAGIAEVCRESYPDHTQFDPSSKYFDPKATDENPRWFMVDIRFIEKFAREVSLPQIRATSELADMVLVNRSRLSVQPVTEAEFEHIVGMAAAASEEV
ncbi:MAG: EVE domain-containing protein [Gemmatimonadota bacterium]|nr:EVE domain-containing protein [Gemmatimonadota bacterium]